MKITSKKEALHILKPEGLTVDYYLFPEYEIHYNEQKPHTTQVWHHHGQIWETIFILTGQLLTIWREDGKEIHQEVNPGDIIETERTPHTFLNKTNHPATYLVIKQVLTGQDKSELFKTDKIID